jgi:hypothetical protein
MYTAFKRQRKHRVFAKFLLIVIPIFILIAVLVWFIFIRETKTESTSFSQSGSKVAYVKPETKVFTTEHFVVTLPASWAFNGKFNPYYNEVYYEYQNKLKNYDNRWLRVYVDVIPHNFALTRILPVWVSNNKLVSDGVDSISDECRTFSGAPVLGSDTSNNAQTWSAKWKDITFTCNMNKVLNYTGTASINEKYGQTLINKNGKKHQYFLVYIDHNIRPDYNLLIDAVKNFYVN